MKAESAKQRVLIVHNYYQIPGGEDTVVENEKKLLEDNGHAVFFYSRSNAELQSMKIWRKLLLPLTTIFNPRTYVEIKKIIRTQRIDIVHVHNTLNLISPSVYYAALSCHVPIVQTIHNFRMLCPGAAFYRDGHICEDCIEHGLGCAVKHRCYRDSRLQTLACVITTKLYRLLGIYSKINYICLTEFNKGKLLQLNRPGRKQIVNRDKVFVKPNFTYAPVLQRGGAKYYLYIGRIEKIKGIEILLNAFTQLPKHKLIIAGTGAELAGYKDLAVKKGISNVEFVGFLNRTELNNILAEAKAVIVPSQWYETFGMVIIEAFAAGVPAVVGNIGNIADLIREHQTGVKFIYNDSSSLADAVRFFETLPAESYTKEVIREFNSKYLPEINYRQFEEIYGKCMENI